LACALLFGCSSPATLKARLANAERHATEAEKLLDEAEREMAALEPDKAEQVLKRAQQALSDPDVGYYPEREALFRRAAADQAKLLQVRRDREMRDLAVAADARQVEVEKALREFRPALEALKKREMTRAEIDRAKDSAGAVLEALEDGKKLEERYLQYGIWAREQRKLVESSRSQIELAKKRLDLVAGPGQARREALTLIARAKSEPSQKQKLKLTAQAREKFARCANDGQRMLIEMPALGAAVVAVGDEVFAAKTLVASCAQRARPPKKAPVKPVRSANRSQG
jgi:hypothetical protein